MSQTLFLTGASSGIGKATAIWFAERGWNVVATMRNPDDGAALAADNVLVVPMDVLDEDAIHEAVAAALARFGRIDALVNNAGYGAYGPLEATPMATVRRQFDVNVHGLIATTRAVLPAMREAKRGVIVNISSVGGRMCYPFGALYHGSKWAVEGLSEALHFELIPLGIRVKLVEPGGVATDFAGRSFVFTNDPAIAEYQPMAQALMAAMAASAGDASLQQPAEVAEVIWQAVHDASARLRFVSGEGARQLLAARYDAEQDEAFVDGMRKRFGLA